jgi:hypothetical protein
MLFGFSIVSTAATLSENPATRKSHMARMRPMLDFNGLAIVAS